MSGEVFIGRLPRQGPYRAGPISAGPIATGHKTPRNPQYGSGPRRSGPRRLAPPVFYSNNKKPMGPPPSYQSGTSIIGQGDRCRPCRKWGPPPDLTDKWGTRRNRARPIASGIHFASKLGDLFRNIRVAQTGKAHIDRGPYRACALFGGPIMGGANVSRRILAMRNSAGPNERSR